MGQSSYLLPSGGSVGEITECVADDGEHVLAVGGGHGGGPGPEAG